MKKLTTAVMVLAAGAAVMADTVTYTDWDPSSGYNTTASGETVLNYFSDFTVPKFNPGLGTLNKVSWYIWAEVQGSVTVVNIGDDPLQVEYSYGSKFINNSPALGIVSEMNLVSYSSPLINLAGGDSNDSPYLISDADTAGQTVSALILANWQGAGDALVAIEHRNRLLSDSSGSLSQDFTQYGRSRIEVTYHYDTGIVPEPGTYVGGLALLAVGGLAYRRMRRAA